MSLSNQLSDLFQSEIFNNQYLMDCNMYFSGMLGSLLKFLVQTKVSLSINIFVVVHCVYSVCDFRSVCFSVFIIIYRSFYDFVF